MKYIVAFLIFSNLIIGCASFEKADVGEGSMEVARQMLSSEQYKEAIIYIRPLQKKHPKNAQLRNLMGLAYLGNGNNEAAEAEFQTEVSLDDSNDNAKIALSYLKIVNKKYPEARNVLNKVINRGTYTYMENVYINYGLSYLEENKCDLAQQNFQKAIRLDPTLVSAHYNAGKCHLKTKNFAAAVKSFKTAVENCTHCVEPNLELSYSYYLAGQKKLAIETAQNVLRMKLPFDKQARARQILEKVKK